MPAPPNREDQHQDEDDDFDVQQFLSTYRRPVIEPSDRFKWLDERRSEVSRLEDEITYL